MDKETAKQRIAKLRKEIDRYRYAYHVLDESLISDAALDSLKKELFDLETEFPDLITSGFADPARGRESRSRNSKK